MRQSTTGLETQVTMRAAEEADFKVQTPLTALSLLCSELPAACSMSKVPERRTLLVTTVDIGDGRSDKVHLREGDSPLVSDHVSHK